MFKEELDFFIENQDALVRQYMGKALVIKGREIYAVYDTSLDAYLKIKRDELLGTVMIQMCLPGPEAYTTWIS